MVLELPNVPSSARSYLAIFLVISVQLLNRSAYVCNECLFTLEIAKRNNQLTWSDEAASYTESQLL